MSAADSTRRNNRFQGGAVVTPQPVNDKSIIESVAGFINEVVPQGYVSGQNTDGKECILWARFEYTDINDPFLYPDDSGGPPLLLVLGYATGAQVWVIPNTGEAQEVLSWRQGVVRTLRVLPSPEKTLPNSGYLQKKRPLVALCDSAGPGTQFCSVSFISLRDGEQVKNIKFKHPVNDLMVNKYVVAITFPEKIAVFDACKFEESFTITTCYPCPGPNPNPVSLGSRWLAFADRRLVPSQRSSGGAEGEGVPSYTATVLHAAKSLTKGLRELGESVASSLTGQRPHINPQMNQGSNAQTGIVTIVDCKDVSSGELNIADDSRGVIAHFIAHANDPVIALTFDPTGTLLLTADKQGHDFHIFKINPHPCGPSLAAVHHLYVLHRGDTTSKVQDMAFSMDSRWVAVSTLRGTTHIFPITPYGGNIGVRTHTSPHVVNRLSRFHRSAGLDDTKTSGRNSPVTHEASPPTTNPCVPYPNPRLPPYPHPTVVFALAQLRQSYLPVGTSGPQINQRTSQRNPVGRASSDEGVPLKVSACFAPPRAWLVGSPLPGTRDNHAQRRAVDSIFVMACHGSLIEYALEPKPTAGIPRDKLCDDSTIQLEVKAKAQWALQRCAHSNVDLQPPLSANNPLLVTPQRNKTNWDPSDSHDKWLSQVEIVTHAGPHRRLWMGPQFTFKTYTTCSSSTGILELETVEIGGARSALARSNPMNMPRVPASSGVVPVLIESGSGSSYDQSPRLMEVYGDAVSDSDGSGPGELQLREDLADAMMESPGIPIRDTGRRDAQQIVSRPVEDLLPRVLLRVAATIDQNNTPAAPPQQLPLPVMQKSEKIDIISDKEDIEIDIIEEPLPQPIEFEHIEHEEEQENVPPPLYRSLSPVIINRTREIEEEEDTTTEYITPETDNNVWAVENNTLTPPTSVVVVNTNNANTNKKNKKMKKKRK